jgi:hypothetical protein
MPEDGRIDRNIIACIVACNNIYIYINIRLTTGWTVRGSNAGGARFTARPDRPWGQPSLLYNGYRVFPGGKVRLERVADHSPSSRAAVMEE